MEKALLVELSFVDRGPTDAAGGWQRCMLNR